ncbi:MAG: DUF134 domain-containing protein [Candidatus Geothermincolia bacterium]
MVRPAKPKLVRQEPVSGFFKPQGIPMRMLEEVSITVEELEAMRLVDVECLYQEEAAAAMGVSRQTIQKMLGEARCKVVRALVEGKALRIAGGSYVLQAEDAADRCDTCGRPLSPGRRKRAGWNCPSCHPGMGPPAARRQE